MERKQIGKSGLFVSELCLGCMTFGEPKRGNHAWTLPEEQSKPLIRQALDAGIDLITISVDGMDETYNKIRYPLKFDETVKKLEFI